MDLASLLQISLYLSMLTFYLGVLIYALPIPITGLKKWGPRLISDAFYVAALSLAFYTILNAASYIASALGANWIAYYGFITGQLTGQLSMIFGLTSITKLVNPRFAPIVSKIVSTLVGKLMVAVYVTTFMYVLGLVIQKSYAALAALGIALMAIPFRIARGAGAFLLSFALVFYVALPLYPHFFSFIILPPQNNGVQMLETVTYIGHSIPLQSSTGSNLVEMQIPVAPGNPPDPIYKIISFIARLVYAVVIGAALYLTLLISISVGLARALGGFGRLRVI
ncbi:MAG: hypothetical protein GXO32_06895 [Crenarchaeota archaeon]|nr:hypothetical protein [Thermoproteota archaeon]